MLSRELMGLLALGILWVNAALIIAVALKQLRRMSALGAALRRAREDGSLRVGEVVSARGSDRFAVRHVHQMGRAITTKGPERILFTDGPQSFELLGGRVETAEGAFELDPLSGAAVEVWPSAERAAATAACGGEAAFDAAYAEANRSKGHAREIDVDIRVGDHVYVWGARATDGVGAPADRPLVVSMVDPAAWVGGCVRRLVGFLTGATLGVAGVTVLALWPPHFGVISTLGGALGLIYFLGVQPLGVAVRNANRSPARADVGGLWQRPAVATDAGTRRATSA